MIDMHTKIAHDLRKGAATDLRREIESIVESYIKNYLRIRKTYDGESCNIELVLDGDMIAWAPL